MVRAVVEEGLAHHTPETLHELVRTGVYKESDVEVRLDRQEKKVPLFLVIFQSDVGFSLVCFF